MVVDNVPSIVDVRIGYVERDGNWSLTLKGQVLEYDGKYENMKTEKNLSLKETFIS